VLALVTTELRPAVDILICGISDALSLLAEDNNSPTTSSSTVSQESSSASTVPNTPPPGRRTTVTNDDDGDEVEDDDDDEDNDADNNADNDSDNDNDNDNDNNDKIARTLAQKFASARLCAVAVVVGPVAIGRARISIHIATRVRLVRVRTRLAHPHCAADMLAGLRGRMPGLLAPIVAALAAGRSSDNNNNININININNIIRETALAESAVVAALVTIEALRLATDEVDNEHKKVQGPASLAAAFVDLVWCMRIRARHAGDAGMRWLQEGIVHEVDAATQP